MAKRKEQYLFGRHKANVRKLSSALSGYGTIYIEMNGRMCGLIAPSMKALEEMFGKLSDQPFNKRKVKKVVLFEHKSVSAIKAR